MVDYCNRDEGITSLISKRKVQTVSSKQLIILVLLLSCFEKSDRPVCTEHIQSSVDAQILSVPAANVIDQ